MDYEIDEFNALVSEIERQGGALLPDKCEGQIIEYKLDKKVDKVKTCECGNSTVTVSTYDATPYAVKKKALERGGGFIKACAVCDSIGLWPRYIKAVSDDV